MKTFVKFGNYTFASCLIIVAVLLAYVAIPTFGNKALIVRSGSMEPTIKTGDLIVVKIAKGVISPVPSAVSKYKEGDVIAFRGDKNPNVLTTHRVVSKKLEAGKTIYQTQGDANPFPDSQLVREEQIVGRSDLTIPKAGKIFAFAKTKNGFALLVLIPALLVIVIESSALIKEIIKVGRARRMLLSDPASVLERSKLLGPVGLRVLMPFVVGLMFFHNSYAFFSDSALSINNTLTTAASFPSPTPEASSSATPTPSPEVEPSPSPSPSPENIANHIVISEVQITGGDGLTTHDFIELYNPTTNPVDLNGHRLVKRTASSSVDTNIKSWTSTAIIPAKGYYLWASSVDTDFPATVNANDFTTQTLAANNSIALRNGALDTGTIIDALSWDASSTISETSSFSQNPGANQSIERKALQLSDITSMFVGGSDEFKGNGSDTNNNATDFLLRSISQPQNSTSSTESL